jgi:release factor glutamine methyltransferase
MIPEAYKRGYQEFYGRNFSVDKRTYVPNKETENLVNEILKKIKGNETIIDVGTGCGSIAITIKLERPKTNVYAVDVSEDALDVAKENAKNHNVEINFFISNYVDNKSLPVPNFIIADLPWGSPEAILHKGGIEELKYMPKIALFHKDGPLGAQSALFKSIQERGWHPKVFIETGLLSKEQVSKIIPKNLIWKFKQFDYYSIAEIQF